MRYVLKSGSLFIFIAIGFLSFFSASFAQSIKYSIGPFCSSNNVICTNPSEVPTCLVLNPKIRVETMQGKDGSKVNRFQPVCSASTDKMLPSCIDVSTDEEVSVEDVVLECVEFVQCQTNQNTNKLTAYCSEGKVPRCLGSDNVPNCESDTICKNDSIPICDYVWQAYVPNSSYK